MKKEKNTRPIYIRYELIGSRPLSYFLPTRDKPRKRLTVRDPSSGRLRPIRYAANCESPYVEDQVKQQGKEDESVFMLNPIVFDGGNLLVDSNDIPLINFLDIHPLNGSKFRKVDKEAEAKEELAIMDLEDRATRIAADSPVEVLMAIVRQFSEENVDNMSEFQIKRNARLFARENPEAFLQVADNPEFELKNVARLAFDAKFMHFRNNNTEIWHSFPGNKSKLMTIPFGEDKYTCFERYLLSNEGLELYDTLKKLLSIE